MSVYWRVLTIFGSFKKITILTQHSKEFWCIGLCTCCGSSSSFLYWGTFTRIWWWNCGATGAVMGFIQIFLLGVTMISSKLAQSLWIMSLWCQFCCKKQNLSGMSPDGKFQTLQCFSTCGSIDMFSRTFRTIEHQVSLNTQLSIRIVRNTPRFSTFWSPNKIPT